MNVSHEFVKSFIYIKNKSGPKIEENKARVDWSCQDKESNGRHESRHGYQNSGETSQGEAQVETLGEHSKEKSKGMEDKRKWTLNRKK